MPKSTKLTFKAAKVLVVSIGMKVKKTQAGDYQLRFKDDNDPDHGYFTTDLQDVIDTAKAMIKAQGSGTSSHSNQGAYGEKEPTP